MGKISVDADQEMIVTVGDLLFLLDRTANLSNIALRIMDKLDEKDNADLMEVLVDLFMGTAKLLPRDVREQIFAEVGPVLGVDWKKFI